MGQNRFGIPFWLDWVNSPPVLEPILVVGLGCSLGVLDFDPWPHNGEFQRNLQKPLEIFSFEFDRPMFALRMEHTESICEEEEFVCVRF